MGCILVGKNIHSKSTWTWHRITHWYIQIFFIRDQMLNTQNNMVYTSTRHPSPVHNIWKHPKIRKEKLKVGKFLMQIIWNWPFHPYVLRNDLVLKWLIARLTNCPPGHIPTWIYLYISFVVTMDFYPFVRNIIIASTVYFLSIKHLVVTYNFLCLSCGIFDF